MTHFHAFRPFYFAQRLELIVPINASLLRNAFNNKITIVSEICTRS